MFYEELYTELGKLFYAIAAADGRVHPDEQASLNKLIETNWKPLEASTDGFGTDLANLISFSFDYEDSGDAAGNGLDSFLKFYALNKDRFTPAIVDNTLQTARAIAAAYRGNNKQEAEAIGRLEEVMGE